jgi:hypothetical protein
MKDHPGHQMEAHHYCHQVNQDFAQYTLFDGNGTGAKGEILSGQLVAPGAWSASGASGLLSPAACDEAQDTETGKHQRISFGLWISCDRWRVVVDESMRGALHVAHVRRHLVVEQVDHAHLHRQGKTEWQEAASPSTRNYM